MLELEDFFEDQLLVRQVKRAQRTAALEMEADDDEVDESRAEEIDDEEESRLEEQRRVAPVQIKGEPQRGGEGSESEDGDEEAMDTPGSSA